jgi:hypothetical protein
MAYVPSRLMEVLERVLDGGIVIDSWARCAPEGITMPPAPSAVPDPLGRVTEQIQAALLELDAIRKGGA